MERFTNSTEKLYNQARLELYSLSDELVSKCRVRLGILSSFNNWFGLSVIQKDSDIVTIIRKEWDRTHDLRRFPLTIYNLDRLRIIENDTKLSIEESHKLIHIIEHIENSPLPNSFKGADTVLDGVCYELELTNLGKRFTWQLFNEKTSVIEPLINYLLNEHE